MNCQYMKNKISELVIDRRDEILENCTEKKCHNPNQLLWEW